MFGDGLVQSLKFTQRLVAVSDVNLQLLVALRWNNAAVKAGCSIRPFGLRTDFRCTRTEPQLSSDTGHTTNKKTPDPPRGMG